MKAWIDEMVNVKSKRTLKESKQKVIKYLSFFLTSSIINYWMGVGDWASEANTIKIARSAISTVHTGHRLWRRVIRSYDVSEWWPMSDNANPSFRLPFIALILYSRLHHSIIVHTLQSSFIISSLKFIFCNQWNCLYKTSESTWSLGSLARLIVSKHQICTYKKLDWVWESEWVWD